MKKRILAAVVAATAVLSLAGCKNEGTSSGSGDSKTSTPAASSDAGGTSTPAESKPVESTPAVELKDDDPTLTILGWDGNEDVPILQEFYKEKTGKELTWVKQGTSGGEAKEKYSDYLKGDGDADILICDAGWAQKYANNGDLVIPMSELGIGIDQYSDAYPYTLEIGTNDKGQFTAPTWQATPGCWVYNAKLAKQYLNVDTPEQMQEKVKDWDTFKKTAEELKEASGGKVKMNATLGGMWEALKSDRSSAWVVDGKYSMGKESDSFIDMAKEYASNGYVDANIGTWTPAWFNTICNDEALGEFTPTWGLKGNPGSMLGNFASGIDDSWAALGEPAKDKFSACAGPMDWYWGGSYLCVTKKCNTKASAAEFIKLMTQNKEAMADYCKKSGDFMNSKTVMKDATFTNPILIGGQDQFQILKPKAEKIDLGGYVTEFDADIGDKVADGAINYAKGTLASKEEAIKAAKKGIVEVYPEITIE